MKKALGYGIIVDPAFSCDYEVDTFTCAHGHCGGRVTDRVPFKSATDDDKDGKPIGGWCSRCDAPICRFCMGKPCVPLVKWIEHLEKRIDMEDVRRSYDEVLK